MLQAFRYVLAHLRVLAARGADSCPLLPASPDDLTILSREATFYRLPELSLAAAGAAGARAAATAGANAALPSRVASATADETVDIWAKASRMQLEFQSVYVTICNPTGLQFSDEEKKVCAVDPPQLAACSQRGCGVGCCARTLPSARRT